MIASERKQMISQREEPLSAQYDPWDPIRSMKMYGKHVLSSIEFTITNMCNMRCEHCAVGDTLVAMDREKLPLPLLLKRLDEVEYLETISITGGEPSLQAKTVEEYIVPLLKYARDRGLRSQLNSNLTLERTRYEMIAPYLDVMHISYNYLNADDFHQVGFARANHSVSLETAAKLYERMMENANALSRDGMFISAESMINVRTHEKLADIHRLIGEMGCRRHEVHPMYPSAFAANLPLLTLEQIRTAIHRLLDGRNRDIWLLFGTLPFYQCSDKEEDRELLNRLRSEFNVTVRNDPDGRNRLNADLFTGDIHVTDFSDVPPLGNMQHDRFEAVFERWRQHALSRSVDCYCPQANCCGPNLLVVNSYYKGIDFTTRQAVMTGKNNE